MEALSKTGCRRRRFDPSGGPERPITAKKVRILEVVAENWISTTEQVAGMAGCTYKVARNYLRDLFDAQLVHRIAVPRVALAPRDAPNEPSLAFGSAPIIHSPTRAGLDYLYELGRIGRRERERTLPEYGPKNFVFLGHEIEVRNTRVWLARTVRRYESHSLVAWKWGTEAHIKPAEPDAWFRYRVTGGGTLVFLVEIDRATETNWERFDDKERDYAALFSEEERLDRATGQKGARVVVVTPDARRAQRIAQRLQDSVWASRYWLAPRSVLESDDLSLPLWRTADDPQMRPLLKPEWL